MSKLVISSTMKVVSELLSRNKFWDIHFALQATKFVIWDLVAFRPCCNCASSQNGSVNATM